MRSVARGLSAIIAAALFAVLPATALADADPASDVLLGAQVFYPYSPPVSTALAKALNAEAIAAQRAHFPIKIALIDSPTDLGAVPSFFGKPQTYAKFLYQELSFVVARAPLLVVMSDGYGTRGLPTISLPKPTGTQSDDLVRAAIAAVPRLAKAAGHPIGHTSDTAGGGGGGSAALPIALGVVAVLVAGGVLALRLRRQVSR